MTPHPLIRSLPWLPVTLAFAWSITLAIPSVAVAQKPPPAPILTLWPDPTYTPDRQCHGGYPVEDLQHYLPDAQLAMSLPGTRRVAVNEELGCLVVTVDGIGSGRLAELVMRGMAVPRHAVLILIS